MNKPSRGFHDDRTDVTVAIVAVLAAVAVRT